MRYIYINNKFHQVNFFVRPFLQVIQKNTKKSQLYLQVEVVFGRFCWSLNLCPFWMILFSSGPSCKYSLLPMSRTGHPRFMVGESLLWHINPQPRCPHGTTSQGNKAGSSLREYNVA